MRSFLLLPFALFAALPAVAEPPKAPARKTTVSIKGQAFLINGQPTYKGRTWNGKTIEGLLMNSRMVQATFDDLNPDTRARWIYPDTKKWDADRNTREFLAAMPEWRKRGLLAVTLNLQGGSPSPRASRGRCRSPFSPCPRPSGARPGRSRRGRG